jgi:hypothetical protein
VRVLHDRDGALDDERDGHRAGAHAVAHDAAGGVGGAATGEPRWLDGESFEIPDLEALDVHPKGPPVKVQRDSFHQQLLLGEDRVAGLARFAVAWSTPDRSDAVRQATVLEFAPDVEVKSFSVDSGLAGSAHKRQPDSPGSRRAEASTRKAEVQAAEGSTNG